MRNRVLRHGDTPVGAHACPSLLGRVSLPTDHREQSRQSQELIPPVLPGMPPESRQNVTGLAGFCRCADVDEIPPNMTGTSVGFFRRRWRDLPGVTDRSCGAAHPRALGIRNGCCDGRCGWSARWRQAVASLPRVADGFDEAGFDQRSQITEHRAFRSVNGPHDLGTGHVSLVLEQLEDSPLMFAQRGKRTIGLQIGVRTAANGDDKCVAQILKGRIVGWSRRPSRCNAATTVSRPWPRAST